MKETARLFVDATLVTMMSPRRTCDNPQPPTWRQAASGHFRGSFSFKSFFFFSCAKVKRVFLFF